MALTDSGLWCQITHLRPNPNKTSQNWHWAYVHASIKGDIKQKNSTKAGDKTTGMAKAIFPCPITAHTSAVWWKQTRKQNHNFLTILPIGKSETHLFASRKSVHEETPNRREKPGQVGMRRENERLCRPVVNANMLVHTKSSHREASQFLIQSRAVYRMHIQ